MALFAIAIPIIPEKLEKWRAFVGELTTKRKAEFMASRKKLGVRERTFHQHTPMGDFVIVTLEGDDPAGAFAKSAAGTDAFSQWFKQNVIDLHGSDPGNPPPGPLPTLIIDSGA